jgi:hypothetical protein
MPLFGRRKAGAPSGPPDETFPFFSVDQAARFRDLARQGFAEAGLEVTVYADHVVDDAGRQFGLANLAAVCHNADKGEREWRGLTAHHAATIVRGTDEPSPFDTMARAELLAATYPRLVPAVDIAQLPMRYAREVVDGVSEALFVDLPETVVAFNDDQVERWGPLEDLRRAAFANLREVRFDERQTLAAAPEGGSFEVFLGESMFTASKLLVLDEVLDQVGVEVDPANGVLVAAPYRHQLALHPIRDVSVLMALKGLPLFARLGFQDGPGPVSPHVYWWRGGELRQVTRDDPDGAAVHVDEDLTEVLNRVC